ncbi:MAG: flagellar basal body rod protein FlgB [Geobacter sp.]|jgi:flagellar basal-body rod protein FlgB|nr:MAG: flagellar basal body rod protein FlgB [Geobacter sp.]
MPIDKLFGSTINLMAKNLDLRAKNQTYIAANVANAETPNYRPKTFSFEDQLKDALKNKDAGSMATVPANPRHIELKGIARKLDDVEGIVDENLTSGLGRDGNGVDLEREMGRMAENQILYNASIQILAKKFEGLKYAIKGGN